MIVEEKTAFDFDAIFHGFQREFGFEDGFRDEVWDEGDRINRNAPSVIDVDGHLTRVKKQYEICPIKVDMNIPDGEAMLHMDELNKLYFRPAVKWLRSQLGDPCLPDARILVCPPPIYTQVGQTTFTLRGLQMFSEYNADRGGTDFFFRVFAATPVK